ncbi:unnamed protein product [Camellia sinensis]
MEETENTGVLYAMRKLLVMLLFCVFGSILAPLVCFSLICVREFKVQTISYGPSTALPTLNL